MRILIVEDEQKIAQAIKRGLEQEAFAVDLAYDGETALLEATNEPFDLIVLDRMLPGGYDGAQIATQLRQCGLHTPILLLTARDNPSDIVDGLSAGADDYLVKPFVFSELVARIRALLRRPPSTHQPKLRYANLVLDPSTMVVKRSGVTIHLSKKEFAILEYMMRNPEHTLSKESIREHVWDFDADILPNTIEVFIKNLRAKVDAPFTNPLIHTVRGFGYRLRQG